MKAHGSRERQAVRGGPPRRVLVVEDVVDAAEALRYALKMMGHDVEVAHDGSSALQLASRFTPEVVLCDLGLPDIDGYALARELRRAEPLRGVCLVALSGHVSDDDLVRARQAGFDYHLAKPARLDEVERVLASAPARGKK